MNVRLTIDVPVRHLTGLEAALNARRLVLRPYIKNGIQRWQIDQRPLGDSSPAMPSNVIAFPAEVA